MDENTFMRLREVTKDILIGSMPDDLGRDKKLFEQCIDEIVDLLQRYHDKNMHPYDYSSIMLELSINGMLKLAPLDQAENFARMARDNGERTRKIISENWPPPDQDKWPYNQ